MRRGRSDARGTTVRNRSANNRNHSTAREAPPRGQMLEVARRHDQPHAAARASHRRFGALNVPHQRVITPTVTDHSSDHTDLNMEHADSTGLPGSQTSPRCRSRGSHRVPERPPENRPSCGTGGCDESHPPMPLRGALPTNFPWQEGNRQRPLAAKVINPSCGRPRTKPLRPTTATHHAPTPARDQAAAVALAAFVRSRPTVRAAWASGQLSS